MREPGGCGRDLVPGNAPSSQVPAIRLHRRQGFACTLCCWPKAENPMNWSPARGMCDFSEHFLSFTASFSTWPLRLRLRGQVEEDASTSVSIPTAGGLRSYSYSSFRTAHETSYRREVLFCSDAVRRAGGNFIAQDTLGIRPAMGSIHSLCSVVLRIHRLLVLLFPGRDQFFIEQLSGLEHRPHDRQELAGRGHDRHFLSLVLAADDLFVEGLEGRALLDRTPDAFDQQPANDRGTFLADVAQPTRLAALVELGRQAEVRPVLLGAGTAARRRCRPGWPRPCAGPPRGCSSAACRRDDRPGCGPGNRSRP